MKLRNLWVALKEWCRNKPKSGLIGTGPGRNMADEDDDKYVVQE